MNDPVVKTAAELIEKSGKTLEEVGHAMGYAPGVGRRAVHQILHRTKNPRIATLRRLAKALGIKMRDLFPE